MLSFLLFAFTAIILLAAAAVSVAYPLFHYLLDRKKDGHNKGLSFCQNVFVWLNVSGYISVFISDFQ